MKSLKRLKQLDEDSAKLKKLVAELSLDRAMLQDLIKRKLQGLSASGGWWMKFKLTGGEYSACVLSAERAALELSLPPPQFRAGRPQEV